MELQVEQRWGSVGIGAAMSCRWDCKWGSNELQDWWSSDGAAAQSSCRWGNGGAARSELQVEQQVELQVDQQWIGS